MLLAGFKVSRHMQAPVHGRRGHSSPKRRHAAADPANFALPTVREMHLQRVATMAAAQATAQATNADIESHAQFASELRSYRCVWSMLDSTLATPLRSQRKGISFVAGCILARSQ